MKRKLSALNSCPQPGQVLHDVITGYDPAEWAEISEGERKMWAGKERELIERLGSAQTYSQSGGRP